VTLGDFGVGFGQGWTDFWSTLDQLLVTFEPTLVHFGVHFGSADFRPEGAVTCIFFQVKNLTNFQTQTSRSSNIQHSIHIYIFSFFAQKKFK